MKWPRDYVLELARSIHADVAWWADFGLVDRKPVVLDVSMCTSHRSVDDSPIRRFRGATLGRGSFADASPEMLELRRGSWSLSAPSIDHLNKFALWDQEFTNTYTHMREMRVFRERRWVRSFYEHYDVYDQLRGFFFDPDGRGVGLVVFWRCGRGPRFDEHDRERLNANMGLICELFPEPHEQPFEQAAYLVLGPDGEVDWSSPGLDWWLTVKCARALAERVREGHTRFVLDGCVVDPNPLIEGQVLCKVLPIAPIRLSNLVGLDARQRGIADLLISGASNAEIAVHMGMSARGVRTAILELSRRLGVTSRFELVVALRTL